MRPLWRRAPSLALWLLLAVGWHPLHLLANCEEVPAGQTLRIRLVAPVSSYSAKPGTLVRAMVVESPQCDGLPFFERGTEVSGRILSVHRVGLGVRHEAAAIAIDFKWISPDEGPSRLMSTEVVGIDDARETIKNGVIHGITPADSPQERLFLPIPLSHLAAWNPYSYWLTPALKAVFPVNPEPEIHFPAGTDLRLRFTSPFYVTSGMATRAVNAEFPESDRSSLDDLVSGFPQRSHNTKGNLADVVNLVFLGSAEQVQNAFRIAGWVIPDAVSRRSVLTEVHAVLADTSDPHLPMAHHLLNGAPPEFALEKSLDSYAKRDHLRIWSQPDTWNGQSIWLSAATGEIGASWSFRRKKFMHNVNPNVDEERQKIVRDLTMAGCVSAVYDAPRPGMPHDMSTTDDTPLHTDGDVAVVRLNNCELPMPQEEEAASPDSPAGQMPAWRPTKFGRFVRTEVLAVRNIWRDNPAYTSYELVHSTTRAIRRDHNRRNGVVLADAAVPAPPAPAAASAAAPADAPEAQ